MVCLVRLRLCHSFLTLFIFSMAVPVNYRPRSRPCYPVPNRDVFARTVKRSPEDCYRSSSSVKPKFSSRAEPLQIEVSVLWQDSGILTY